MHKKDIKRKKKILLTLVIFLITWSLILFFVDIDSLTQLIGVHNLYIILFVVAAISGTSFLTSASFYAIFLSYASSGLNPLMIGLIGGLGMSIGDTLFFFISKKAGDILHMENNKTYKKVFDFISHLPHSIVYLIVFVYAAFTPIPNDVLVITLGLLQYRYKFVIPIIIVGNIVLLTLVALGIFRVFV
jgi:membrane protein YqaA with SNARE-associated domain